MPNTCSTGVRIVTLLCMLLAACEPSPQGSSEPSQPATAEAQAPKFNCEGKTHCPEMSSCEEATFYINNCPGTEMDGDNDGVPCESQWCNR